MSGGVQNRLLAAFPPTHINQVVWCELVPKEGGDKRFMWLEAGDITWLSAGNSSLEVTVCGKPVD